jgi:hypothetical protein
LAILWIARYYGLYSSRKKGKAVKDGSLEKFGYKVTPERKTSQNSEHEMRVIAVITNPGEFDTHSKLQKIPECLKRNHDSIR